MNQEMDAVHKIKPFRQSFQSLPESFRNAFIGILFLWRSQRNARKHGVATLLVLGLSFWSGLDFQSLSLVLIVIILVWVAETLNSVIEVLTDKISPGFSREARLIKDMAAGAVLIAAFGALMVGLLVLGPPLWQKIAGSLHV